MKFFLFSIFAVLNFAAVSGSARTMTAFGNMPLFFETGSAGQFLAHGQNYEFSISTAGSQILLQKNPTEMAAVRMQLVGTNPLAQIHGDGELPGKINYLIGSDPAQWQTALPTFSKVRVAEIYPGIDLVYHGNQKQLEYDFEIAPGADPNAIRIHFDGAEKIFINAQGELILKLNGGEIRQPAPEIFQISGGRKTISGGFKILDAHTVAFAVGYYDHSLPLVIDPTLAFSTYFGGTSGDTAWSVALNPVDGSIYVAGQTFSKRISTNGPAFNPFSTDGAYQETFGGGKLTGDGFVAKFDSTGTILDYLTYLGGTNDEYVSGIAVDANGDAFVCGFTDSTNFPTANALYSQISGTLNKKLKLFPGDAFVAELDTNGSSLVYSTYLGGSGVDAAQAIAIDSAGDAYVTGFTSSTNFPMANAIPFGSTNLDRLTGTNNAFVAEIGPGGSPLLFSSYLGGKNFDVGEGIAVDADGYIYVSGYTSSTNFPTTSWINFTNLIIGVTNQIVATNVMNGHFLNSSTNRTFAYDAFVTKLQPSGAGFVYSTLLGGDNNDVGYRVACDGSGGAYVTGYSASPNFPNTATNVPGLHSFVETNQNLSIADEDVFVTKITNDVSGQAAIAYSALFGGRRDDVGYGIAVDAADEAFVTGYTLSTNFPVANVPANLPTNAHTNMYINISENLKNKTFPADVFVIAFDSAGTNLLYSAYFGGDGNDYGYNIAVDAAGDAFIVGQTASTNFPTLSAGQSFRNGTNDAFLFEIQP